MTVENLQRLALRQSVYASLKKTRCIDLLVINRKKTYTLEKDIV